MASYAGALHASRCFHMLAAADSAQSLGRECRGKERELNLGVPQVVRVLPDNVRCAVNIGI